LLIDRFHEFVERRSPGKGFKMGMFLLIVLFFADDLLIVAKDADELQHFLDLFKAFCSEIKLQVNVSKTFGVVFNAPSSVAKHTSVQFDGRPIKFVEEVKYLGVACHASKGMKSGFKHLLAAAHRAVHAVHKKCHVAHVHLPASKCKLFDSLVMPVCTYACEVWVPGMFDNPIYDKCLKNDMDKLHINFLRGLFQLRKSTSVWMILREFGKLPVFFYWWSKVLKFLMRLRKLDESCFLKQVFLHECELFLTGKECWLSGIMSFMRNLYPTEIPQRVHDRLHWMLNKPVARVKKDMVSQWKQMWSDVHAGVIHAPKLLFYHTYMASTDAKTKYGWFAPARHLCVAMSDDVHVPMVRFRLGNHDLLIEQRRWVKQAYKESFDCTCRLCSSGSTETEAHFLLDCPFYEVLRMDDKFSDLVLVDHLDLRSIFTSPHQIVLAKFITAMINFRLDSL
jgi:hypothetical protein